MQETTVATDGMSAEYGRFSGGVVNIITKSGGNRFAAPSATRSTTTLARRVRRSTTRIALRDRHRASIGRHRSPTYEYVLGGPILRDQLWFFTAGRFRTAPVGRTPWHRSTSRTRSRTSSQRYEGKVTYSATRITGSTGDLQPPRPRRRSTTPSARQRHDGSASLYTRELPHGSSRRATPACCRRRSSSKARTRRARSASSAPARTSTDLIDGTLLIDSARGNLRYWSATRSAASATPRGATTRTCS